MRTNDGKLEQISALTDQRNRMKVEIDRLRQENEQLTEKCRQLMEWYDRQNGTPCEQIRHQQEVEALREYLKSRACVMHDRYGQRQRKTHWDNFQKIQSEIDAARDGEG